MCIIDILFISNSFFILIHWINNFYWIIWISRLSNSMFSKKGLRAHERNSNDNRLIIRQI